MDVCCTGEYGWSAPVESMDGLVQLRVWTVCSSGEFGWSASVDHGWSAPVESMDGLLQYEWSAQRRV